VNPNFAEAEFHAKQAQEAARLLGVQIHVVRASTVDEFDTAFSILVQQKAGGLFHANDAFFISERRPLIALAARHSLPTMYPWREFVVDGGLMSYSPSLVQAHRLAGEYTGKILKGAKPADLPVVQPNKFEFVINLKTAKESRSHLSARTARHCRRGHRIGAPAQSWCDPAGESPAQVRSSVRLVASVAWPLATVVAKRTQRLHGVWD
jgi:ABC-type uncharacterized transport system substrate-binding protein